ncbi:MAG: hypothetical protein ACPGYT_04705 [Nitrospirales bacterium]
MHRVTSSSIQPKSHTYDSLVVLLFTLILLFTPGIATQAALADTGDNAKDVGLGLASFVTTLPYGAVKIAYAGLGAIIGGFTYLLTAGDVDTANIVWEKSLLGTYVITPDHLTGDKPVRFIGP